jgi:hypothetical protein
MRADQDTFVVAAGTWRLLLVPLILIGALAFFPLAAVLLFIDVDSLLVRLLLWVFALVLLGIGISILLIGLSLFTRIEVGKDRLKVRVPRWRGPLAMVPWMRAEIPYRDIKAVERRDEFYGASGFPRCRPRKASKLRTAGASCSVTRARSQPGTIRWRTRRG